MSNNYGNFLLKSWFVRASSMAGKLHIPSFIILLIAGIVSSIWFLIRVIPKPSRAAYPCMKNAAPFMSSLFIYILSLAGFGIDIKKGLYFLFQRKFIFAFSFFITAVSAFLLFGFYSQPEAKAIQDQQEITRLGPEDKPNQPFGTPVGIFPGRVVWTWNPEATNENCISTVTKKDWFWKPENIDEKVVGSMFRESVMALTGEKNVSDSWASCSGSIMPGSIRGIRVIRVWCLPDKISLNCFLNL